MERCWAAQEGVRTWALCVSADGEIVPAGWAPGRNQGEPRGALSR